MREQLIVWGESKSYDYCGHSALIETKKGNGQTRIMYSPI